jgi:hypothetical protein
MRGYSEHERPGEVRAHRVAGFDRRPLPADDQPGDAERRRGEDHQAHHQPQVVGTRA